MDKRSLLLWRAPWVVALCLGLALIGLGLTAVADAGEKARIVENGYGSDGRLRYRVDIGDTSVPRALANVRLPIMGEHGYNARVFAKTHEGQWIHKDLAELPKRPVDSKESRVMTSDEFRAFLKALEDEREVRVANLPIYLPDDLMAQVWAIWYWHDNNSLTLYLEALETRKTAERIVAFLNATRM